MKNKKKILYVIIGMAAIAAIVASIAVKKGKKSESILQLIKPHYGEVVESISATGTVLPYNRLEIKPQVNGRMESVLVEEGQKVRKGQVLGWMSSTERAALIDAARAQGAGSLKYWEDAYKPIAIVAPINGTVIVRGIEPGQAALTTAAILVLSDRLIVKADVDETDIGRVKTGQRAVIRLDAYPDIKVNGRVDLIEYESKIVNNVTMYEVNIVPDNVPSIYRSGMSADIDIIQKSKNHTLMIPTDAVVNENGKNWVWVVPGKNMKPVKRQITTGLSDDRNIEVVSGLNDHDTVAVMAAGVSLDVKQGSNPFMPTRKKPH